MTTTHAGFDEDDMTRVGTQHRTCEPAAHEQEQIAAAFAEVAKIADLPLRARSELSDTARTLARRLFEVGWIAGARSGTTWPALSDTPLPPHVVRDAFDGLASAMRGSQDPDPKLYQRVEYHGRIRAFHGRRYWVTRIAHEASGLGHWTACLLRLSTWRQDTFFEHELYDVNAWNVDPIPGEFFDL